jgi:hypothetical protein
MELTRRDAVAALVAGGAVVAGAVSLGDGPDADAAPDPDADLEEDLLRTLTAAAAVLYPSEVEGHRAFVERYVLGRIEARADYRAGVTEAAAELDAVARDWEDAAFTSLSRERRDDLLRSLGVDTADPDAEGPISERIRRYVVNELLFALYASPAGGRLVGIENPVGYPGGTESYQRATTPGEDGDGE